jgi:hypothetical protein
MTEALVLLSVALVVVPLVAWGVVRSGIDWTQQQQRRGVATLVVAVDLSKLMQQLQGISEALAAVTMTTRTAAEQMTTLRDAAIKAGEDLR